MHTEDEEHGLSTGESVVQTNGQDRARHSPPELGSPSVGQSTKMNTKQTAAMSTPAALAAPSLLPRWASCIALAGGAHMR